MVLCMISTQNTPSGKWKNVTHTNRILACGVDDNTAARQIDKVHNYYKELYPHDPTYFVDCNKYSPFPRQRITRSNPHGVPKTRGPLLKTRAKPKPTQGPITRSKSKQANQGPITRSKSKRAKRY